jgi:DNA polymerase-3 subunit epsilon
VSGGPISTQSASSPPPAGPPWDLSIDEAPLCFVDLEMTGLDVRRDRVIEICVERTVGGRVTDRVDTLVSPLGELGDAADAGTTSQARETSAASDGPPGGAAPVASVPSKVGNEHVHGITAEALAGAPRFADVADHVLALLDGAIVVAHAAAWDVSFLTMELDRAGRRRSIDHYLDTLVLARRAFAFPSYSLDALCGQLGIERGRAHRAGADVAAMRRVFERVVAPLAPVSARDLWEVRVAERRARAAIVGACVAAMEKGAPVQITYRPSKRKPEPMVMVLTEVRADLDPPRVIGYQLPGRGRRDLRSDRILRVEPAPPSPD